MFPVSEIIKNTVDLCDLWHNIFKVESSMRDLCSHFIARLLISGSIYALKNVFSRFFKFGYTSPLGAYYALLMRAHINRQR